MNEFSKRLQEVIAYYNINAGAFAKKVGVQKSSLSHLLSGRNKPSFLFINKMAEAYPEINISWFVTGKGSMLDGHKPQFTTSSSIESTIDKEKKYKNIDELNTSLDNTERKALQDIYQEPNIKQILIIYDDDSFKVLKQAKK